MKTKLTPLFALLLAALLLCAVACGDPESNAAESTADTTASTNTTGNPANAPTSSDGTAAENITQAATPLPIYPGDIELDLPEMQEKTMVTLSLKDGQILGFSSLRKPLNDDIIDNYMDFQNVYGTVEGIDESFFESHVFRLAHSAHSSGSTRYAIESTKTAEGKIQVEIIEQHAAMSTRDLRKHYVLIAVEKAYAETPLDVHVTGVQLAS